MTTIQALTPELNVFRAAVSKADARASALAVAAGILEDIEVAADAVEQAIGEIHSLTVELTYSAVSDAVVTVAGDFSCADLVHDLNDRISQLRAALANVEDES